MKNLLVTGALGFIGSNFINYMSLKYPHMHFTVLDKKDYCSSVENINKQSLHNTDIIIGDIANKELVLYLLTKNNIDTVIHFAAQTHVDNSFFNSIEFTKTNVLGTHILLETIRIYHENTNSIEKFIHVSTDEVYGEVNDNIPRDENSPLECTSPYSASKAAAEFIVKSYYHSYKLPIIITRGNNVYGPNQFPEKVIPRFICKLIDGEKLPIQGKGTSRRNFIHAHDTCTAFETILLKGSIGETYNISASHDNEFSVLEIAKMLIELFHKQKIDDVTDYVEFIEDRNFNDSRYFISSDKLETLGWKIEKNNFIETLEELIEWYKNNKDKYNYKNVHL